MIMPSSACSEKSVMGWVSLELGFAWVGFPFRNEADQHRYPHAAQRKYHATEAVHISARDGKIKNLKSQLHSIDECVEVPLLRKRSTGSWIFEQIQADMWWYAGLQFFSGSEEIFNPLVPCVKLEIVKKTAINPTYKRNSSKSLSIRPHNLSLRSITFNKGLFSKLKTSHVLLSVGTHFNIAPCDVPLQ